MMNAKCKKYFIVGIMLCICLAVSIPLYIYYTITIKERPFPENGILSPSGCYVTNIYFIPQKDSYIINIIYYYPAFIKVFDAKTKECLYTSDIYDLPALSPLLLFENETSYGFMSINTECKDKFIPPKEFTPDF